MESKETQSPAEINETWLMAAIAVYAALQTKVMTDDRLCARRAFTAADQFVSELERQIAAQAKQGDK